MPALAEWAQLHMTGERGPPGAQQGEGRGGGGDQLGWPHSQNIQTQSIAVHSSDTHLARHTTPK